MNFKNGKRKIGLIALFSCIFTATVAFAAYTGYNYINGTVTVEGNPFKIVFANMDGSDVENNTIDADQNSEVVEGAMELSDLTVSDDGTKISSFTVTLPADVAASDGAQGGYGFVLRNDGGAPAYLTAIDCGNFDMPLAGDGSATSGLTVTLMMATQENSRLPGALVLRDGVAQSGVDGEIVVPPGEFIQVGLIFAASRPKEGHPVWEAVDADGNYGAEITLPQIQLTWSAVPLTDYGVQESPDTP